MCQRSSAQHCALHPACAARDVIARCQPQSSMRPPQARQRCRLRLAGRRHPLHLARARPLYLCTARPPYLWSVTGGCRPRTSFSVASALLTRATLRKLAPYTPGGDAWGDQSPIRGRCAADSGSTRGLPGVTAGLSAESGPAAGAVFQSICGRCSACHGSTWALSATPRGIFDAGPHRSRSKVGVPKSVQG